MISLKKVRKSNSNAQWQYFGYVTIQVKILNVIEGYKIGQDKGYAIDTDAGLLITKYADPRKIAILKDNIGNVVEVSAGKDTDGYANWICL